MVVTESAGWSECLVWFDRDRAGWSELHDDDHYTSILLFTSLCSVRRA